MQTGILAALRDTSDGREADRILRACTHCGFCTATCPTYQLLGDERDGPRGRIYLIKQVLEGGPVGASTQRHLDRCLRCHNCETTCPADVAYTRLADIGRAQLEARVRRPPGQRLLRWGLRHVVAWPRRFALVLALARLLRPLLPHRLARTVPPRQKAGSWPRPAQARRMLVLDGCVQPAATPATNAAAARVLSRLGIDLVAVSGCCGALDQHLGARAAARARARANIDALWPGIAAGAEAVVITASGCGAQLREYGWLLRDDPEYSDKAAQLAKQCRDLGEVLAAVPEAAWQSARTAVSGRSARIAWHAPCTLRNARGADRHAVAVLQRLGFELVPVADSHLCCGSAGSYSLLQPEIAGRLRADKLQNLQQGRPECIATANVGCQLHLAAAAEMPVRHWVELVDEALTPP